MNSRAWATMRRRFVVVLSLCVVLVSGCTPREEMLGASISGYNHTDDQSIYTYTVNGNMGSNLGPGGGGGSFSCCVAIPMVWRPGIKVKVWWHYASGSALPPEPPPHVAEMELPEYKTQDIGSVQVHFYPDQKIRLLVSDKNIGHINYPRELEWGKPTPADAIAGMPLPFPPEPNPETDATRPGETYEQRVQRVEDGLKRAEARRQAKQARWDVLVARKAAGRPISPSTLPKLLPPEPMPEVERVHVPAARSDVPLSSSPT